MVRNLIAMSCVMWLAVAMPAIAAEQVTMQIDQLQCEYQDAPQAVDVAHPRLSWKLASMVRGQRQSAYQILVASTTEALQQDTGDLWDSGRVMSDQSFQILFAGKPLSSGSKCFWKVRAWDKDGKPAAWSQPATWSMGLLDAADWHGKWIGGDTRTAMPWFRHEFTATKPIRRAMIFICGLGQFELHVNGQKVGQDLLQPGWTNYRKTCLYVAMDVTAQLHQGPNTLGVLLGNGMYNVTKGRYTKFVGSFGPPVLIAQLNLEYTDGTSEQICTDSNWKVAPSPITFSSIYGGEDFDARLETAGWDKPGLDDSSWKPAIETHGPGGKLVGASRSAPPIRVAQVLAPKSVHQPKPGIWVYDLGQNCAEIPRITVTGPAGAQIKLTPGELLNRDGTVSQESSGRGAYCVYTLKGGGEETWSPRFFYYGSRYVQMDGATPAGEPMDHLTPVLVKLEGQYITSSTPQAGEFSCSNEQFTRTADLIRWAIGSNMVSVLTDCPHREKLGWLEEVHLMGPSLMYSRQMPTLFGKICGDMADAQRDNGLVPDIAPEFVVFNGGFVDSPEWGSASILVPWQLYEWYGDVAVLRDRYDTMRRYVDYLGTKSRDHIVSHGLGDWYDIGPKAPGYAQLTPIPLTATAFYFKDLVILEKTARLLGHTEDAQRYAVLSNDVKDGFNQKFYDARTHQYVTGSQTANALPLVFGLAPQTDCPAIVDNIVSDIRQHDNSLTAGDVGYRYLLRALADGGRSDVIFDMNSRSNRPGYGYMLTHGATSLTEAWDARASSSQNHFMLGHILEWFYSDLAGIAPDAGSVGFDHIRIRPSIVGDVKWAKASYQSVRGTIAVDWKQEADEYLLNVTVPVGSTATVYIPATAADAVTESGKPAVQADGVRFVKIDGMTDVFEVQSGEYHFASH